MKLIDINHYKVSYPGRRKTNEDSVLIEIDKKDDYCQVVIAVADGMGGSQKGEIASKMMIEQLQRLIRQNLSPDPKLTTEIVRKHVNEANRNIFANTNKIEDIQMGTTVSGAVVINDRYLVFNVGDSRTYLINSDDIKQVTQDHSADGDQLRNGVINESKVGKGRYSYALTRSVGTDAEVEADIFPNQSFYQLREGEIILCCTDGLWKSLTKQEIYREIFGRKNLAQSLEALAALAFSKGSDDNISIAALEYGNLKRGKKKLDHFVPMSKMVKKNKRDTVRKLFFLLLAIFVILFLAILAIVIIKLNNSNPPPAKDNQIQKMPEIVISKPNYPVQVKADDNNKTEGWEEKIASKPNENKYSGGDKSKPEIITIESLNQLDPDCRENIIRNTDFIRIEANEVENVKKKTGIEIIEILIFISNKGEGHIMNISGIEVEPENKLKEVKASLERAVQEKKFLPPSIGGRRVNAKILIQFIKVKKFNKIYILSKY